MIVLAFGRRSTGPRGPSRAARIASTLWIALAVIVWNDVFDQVIIDAGRHYVFGAFASAATGGPFLRMADAMRPARARAFWAATAAALPVLVVGLAAVRFATRGEPIVGIADGARDIEAR